MTMANPGSIYEQFRRDRESKESLFQIPGAHLVFEPWSDLRTYLDEKFGFRPSFSFTHIYQWASDSVGPEDDVSGYEVAFDATWTALGRGNRFADDGRLRIPLPRQAGHGHPARRLVHAGRIALSDDGRIR